PLPRRSRCWPGPPEPNLDPAASTSYDAQRGCERSIRARWSPWVPNSPSVRPGRTGAGADAGAGPPADQGGSTAALIHAGRRRNIQGRVVAVHNALAAQPLAALEPMVAAYREVVGALVAVLGCLNVPVAALEQ